MRIFNTASARNLMLGAVSAMVVCAPAQAQAIRDFNIEPQGLTSALEAFGRQSGSAILFDRAQIQGKTSPGVRGAFAPADALRRLLQGSNATFSQPNAATFVVNVSAATGATAVDDVIVTAQKRAQNIQDVPLAVTVVTGQQLENQNVREFTDLAKVSPSLTIRPSDSAQNASVSLRGIGTFAFSIGVESAVAIQIDDVPVAFQARAFSDLSDIERIEVLRGPQSTLYGKNASAGLINIVTSAPSSQFTGRATVTATTDSEYRVAGSVSGPIGDTLGFRLSGSYSDFDGNVDNLTTGETVNGSKNSTLRGKLVWTPTEALTVDLGLNYFKVDSDPTFTYRVLSPNVRLRGNATQTLDVIMPGITAGPDNLQATLNDQPYYRAEGLTKSIRATYALPNDFTLVSITAHDDFTSFDQIDSDRTESATIANVANGMFDADALSQEIRLLSPSDGSLTYTIGAFFSDSEQRRAYKRGPAFSLADWNATSGSEQMALFAQADWKFLPATTATLGVRGQREEIDYTFNDLRVAAPANGSFAGDSRDDVVTYRAGLKHDVSDNLMVFGSYARGHKGQIYDLTTGFNQVRADLGPIRPEKSDAYEIGLRAQTSDRRLTFNATLFQVEYEDLQTQSIEDINGVPTFRLTNVGKSRTRGLEVDFLARPIEGLSIYGGGVLLDARFVDYATATCYPGQTAQQGCTGTPARQDLSGARLGVPRVKLNVGWDYAMPMGSYEGLFGGSYTWQDETPSSDPMTRIDAYGVLNLSAGVRSGDGRWTARLFVNNLLDEGYPVAIGNQRGNFGNQDAIDFLPGRDFKRYAGLRLSTEF
jgi:iron complex outermembrane receptor protein